VTPVTFDIGSNLAAVLMALIAAAGSFVAAFFAYKASNKTIATHNLVNGRMTQLLTTTNAISRAQGVAAGVAGDLSVPPITVYPGNPAEMLAAPTAETFLAPPK
jgi:molybdopterin-biosynthesis enzyme MoeA-like protein